MTTQDQTQKQILATDEIISSDQNRTSLIGKAAIEHYRMGAQEYRRQDDKAGAVDRLSMRLRSELDALKILPKKVLDLGCGTGRFFHTFQDADLIVGVDVSSEMLEEAKHPTRHINPSTTIKLIYGDITQSLPIDNDFNVVISIGTIGYHLPLSLTLLQQMKQYLSPRGAILLVTQKRIGLSVWKLIFQLISTHEWLYRLIKKLYPKIQLSSLMSAFSTDYNSVKSVVAQAGLKLRKCEDLTNETQWPHQLIVITP